MIELIGGLAAFFASLAGAFSGGGSALILFPILLIFAPFPYISLLAITKASSAILTLVSGQIHRKKNHLELKLLFVLVVSALIGTTVGTYFVQYHFDETLFTQIMAALLLFAGIYLLVSKSIGIKKIQSKKITINLLIITFFFSFFINIINGFLGGVGILMTIYLASFLRMSFIKAIAHTMAIYGIVNFFHAVYLISIEHVNVLLLLAVLIGSLIGAVLGTNLQYIQGNVWVKRASIVMLFVIGLRLLFYS